MTPPARLSKAFSRPRLARFVAPVFVSLAFLLLACLVLPQQAAAQDSFEFGAIGSTFTIFDADPVEEGGTARFRVTVEPVLSFPFSGVDIIYTGVTASLDDLGSTRPTEIDFNATDGSYIIEVPINDDDTVEEEESFTVGIRLTGTRANIQATGTINASDDTPAAVAPQITTQPTDQSVTVGENATFTVTATGTPTPTYTSGALKGATLPGPPRRAIPFPVRPWRTPGITRWW